MRQKTHQERCGSPYLLDDILALLIVTEPAPLALQPFDFPSTMREIFLCKFFVESYKLRVC